MALRSSDPVEIKWDGSAMKIYAVGKPEVPVLDVGQRLKNEIVYYVDYAAPLDGPKMQANEYWITASEAAKILDEGVVKVASPLQAANSAEIEISEDAERLLEWALEYDVNHIVLK